MVEQLRMRYMFAIVTANREKLHGPIKVHTNDEIRYFRHSILRLMSGAFDIRNIAIDKNSNDGKMYLAVAFGGCIGLHAEVNKKNLLYLLGHVGNRFGKKPFSDFCSLVQEQKLWHLLEYDREVSELVRRYGEKNDARTSGEVENTRGLSLGMA